MKCFVRTCQIIIGPYSSHFPIQRGLQNAQSQTNDSNNTPIHQRRGSEMIEVIRQRVRMSESNAFLSKVQRTSDFRGNQTFYTCASGPWTAHDETWKIQILVITTVYKLHRSGNIFPVCLCSEIDLWVAKHCVCVLTFIRGEIHTPHYVSNWSGYCV